MMKRTKQKRNTLPLPLIHTKKLTAASHNVHVKFSWTRICILLFGYLAVSLSDASVRLRCFYWLHYTLQFASTALLGSSDSVSFEFSHGVLASLIAPFSHWRARRSKNQRKIFPFFCSQQKYHANRGKRHRTNEWRTAKRTSAPEENYQLAINLYHSARLCGLFKNWLDIQYV